MQRMRTVIVAFRTIRWCVNDQFTINSRDTRNLCEFITSAHAAVSRVDALENGGKKEVPHEPSLRVSDATIGVPLPTVNKKDRQPPIVSQQKESAEGSSREIVILSE